MSQLEYKTAKYTTGFNVYTEGHTSLIGGVIAGNREAAEQGKNRFSTASLSTQDIANHADYQGSGWGATMGFELGQATQNPKADLNKPQEIANRKPESSMGAGSDEASASSTTASGISAGELEIRNEQAQQAKTGQTAQEALAQLNREADSEQDGSQRLEPIFDKDKVRADIHAQIAITAEFGKAAAKAVGDYAQGKLQEAALLHHQAQQETDPEKKAALTQQAQDLQDTWGEGKPGRMAAHTALAALAGGLPGAAGAAASQSLIPQLGEALNNHAVPEQLQAILLQLAGAGIGAASGGTSGAAAGLNITANNYLKHAEIVDLVKLQEKKRNQQCNADCEKQIQALQALNNQRDQELKACEGNNSAACENKRDEVRKAYAEILRKLWNKEDIGGLRNYAQYTYEANSTAQKATDTLSKWEMAKGMPSGIGKGAVNAVNTTGQLALSVIAAVFGNEASQERLKLMYETLTDIDKLTETMRQAGVNYSNRLADAYENNNAYALGQMRGEIVGDAAVGAAVGAGVGKAGTAIANTVGKTAGKLAGQVANKADELAAVTARTADKVDDVAKTAANTAKTVDKVEDVVKATSSGGTANAATGVKLADDLASTMSKPVVQDKKLATLMDELYRDGAKIGTGSTADAVRYEMKKGVPVGGVWHSQKAGNYSKALEKWLKDNPNASFSDRSAASNVLRDLQNSLRGR